MGKIKSVAEALGYLKKVNGMEYSDEMFKNIQKFIELLPVSPLHMQKRDYSVRYLIMDYDSKDGFYGDVIISKSEDGTTFECDIDIDFNQDTLSNRAQSNAEAYQLIAERKEIDKRDPYIYDPYFDYSDDHKYVNKCEELARKAHRERTTIDAKLI